MQTLGHTPPGNTGDHRNPSARAENGRRRQEHLDTLRYTPRYTPILRVNITQPPQRLPTRNMAKLDTPDSSPLMPPPQGHSRIRTPRTARYQDGNIRATLHRRIPLTHSQQPRTPTEQHHLRLLTQHQGILATLTINIWYIAKPPYSPVAAPGYYIASDGRRKYVSLCSSPPTDNLAFQNIP
jgi:hypothetical protein